jgi:hypothetical protein
MKAAIVVDINEGKLTVDHACEKYDLSGAEIREWQSTMKLHGLHGLRVTRLHCYHPERRRNKCRPRWVKPLAALRLVIAAPAVTAPLPASRKPAMSHYRARPHIPLFAVLVPHGPPARPAAGPRPSSRLWHLVLTRLSYRPWKRTKAPPTIM